MTKQTVYLNNIATKSGFRTALSQAVCVLNSPLLERSDDLSNQYEEVGQKPARSVMQKNKT